MHSKNHLIKTFEMRTHDSEKKLSMTMGCFLTYGLLFTVLYSRTFFSHSFFRFTKQQKCGLKSAPLNQQKPWLGPIITV